MRSIIGAVHPSRLVERDRGRHRGVQRLAARSGCGRRGRRPRRPRRAGPSRSAPTTSVVPVERARAAARRRAATSATRGAGQLRDARHARDRHGEDRAHRRAHRLGAERVGAVSGPSATRRGAEGQRAAQHRRRRCPGRATPHSATHSGPAGARPALLVDAERARARAQRRDAVEQLGLDVDARRAARRPPASPRRAAAASRSSPSATKRRSRRRWSRRTSLSLSLWGLVIIVGRLNKKGADPEGAAPGRLVRVGCGD